MQWNAGVASMLAAAAAAAAWMRIQPVASDELNALCRPILCRLYVF